MIKKFIYKLDIKNKMNVVGLVEDNTISDFIPDTPICMENIDDLKLEEDERLVKNEGRLGYLVIDDEITKYVDLNVFDKKARIKTTENLAYAALLSEDMFEAILNYANYFDSENVRFVKSGMQIKNDLIYDDYNHYFKNATDASYIKINKGNKAYFVAKDADYTYSLTTNFSKAFKVQKNLIRKVLEINEFIDSKTERSSLSFSSFKALRVEDGYIYAGLNPSYVCLSEDKIEIIRDPIIPTSAKLINDESIFNTLKDISYLISKEKTDKSFYLEINSKYVKKVSDLSYVLVTNPSEASLLLDYDIEIIKSSYKLFDSKASILRKNRNYFLYVEDDKYILSSNPKDIKNGRMIDNKAYNDFTSLFNTSFNNSDRDNGIILIKDDMYVSLNIINNALFEIKYHKDAYSASVFSKDEVLALKNLVKINFKERSLENLLKNLSEYSIYENDNIEIDKVYESIMSEIISKKTTVVPYNTLNDLRCETEKGALEYLRRFYLKDLCDYKDLFDKTLNSDVKNILIIAPKFNIELEALALSSKQDVFVYTLNESKFGYNPVTYLTKHINYKGTYRLKLSNLTKKFIEKFDMIVFGKNFNEDKVEFKDNLDMILNNKKDIILVSSKTANFEKNVKDPVYEYFKDIVDVKRKYHTYEFMYKDLIDSYNIKFNDYLLSIGSNYNYLDALYDKTRSYHTIVIKKDNKLFDYYNKENN